MNNSFFRPFHPKKKKEEKQVEMRNRKSYSSNNNNNNVNYGMQYDKIRSLRWKRRTFTESAGLMSRRVGHRRQNVKEV